MIDFISAALGGDGPPEARYAAALRLRCELQPAAGAGAKVMPPTYADANGKRNSPPVYITEVRRVDGADVNCTLLDSVASQSNRIEEALLTLINERGLPVPDVHVDQAEFGRHSALRFSHRIFDSWVEDATLDGTRFGDTDLYAALASVINRGLALPLIQHFPAGLLLGCWASRKRNPQGTTRLARAITSEIIAINSREGVKPKSKIDLHHVSAGIQLQRTETGAGFRIIDPESSHATGKTPRAKPKLRPAELIYGNVTPSIDVNRGGVTMDRAEQHTIISLAALRATVARSAGDDQRDASRDLAVRIALSALAITMLEAQSALGWELRSGCHLVPTADPTLELVGRLGQTVAAWPLLELGGPALLDDAASRLAAHGIDWRSAPLQLTAAPEQLELLRTSLNRADGSAED